MSFAAVQDALSADLLPAQGVESILLGHMAKASAFADDCFERAGKAKVREHRASELRLATRLTTLLARLLDALQRHREQTRKAVLAAYREKHQARFDQMLHLAAMADSAVERKAKRAAVPQGTVAPPEAASQDARPLSRQQRRAAERRARKAEKRLRNAAKTAQGP